MEGMDRLVKSMNNALNLEKDPVYSLERRAKETCDEEEFVEYIKEMIFKHEDLKNMLNYFKDKDGDHYTEEDDNKEGDDELIATVSAVSF